MRQTLHNTQVRHLMPGKQQPRPWQWLRRILIALMATALLLMSGLSAALAWGWTHTPAVNNLPALVRASLAQAHAPYTPLAEIPLNLQHAIIAIEDERFYSNHGIDIIGLVRAAWDDLRAGRIIEGASTITQQLAENAYLPGGSDHTISQKLEVMILALKIDHTYRKGQILAMYLNLIYFGDGAHGIGQAAQRYFHTTPASLDLAECALLAGLPQSPSGYDPYHHPLAAAQRQRAVLNQMVADGYITTAQAQSAAREISRLFPAQY
jgi:membrane peptidoglycan carboxypeptidase